MNSILNIINSINNINKSIDNYNKLSTLFVDNDVYKKNNIMSNIENLCEYVDNPVKNINNVNNRYNNSKTLENISNISNINNILNNIPTTSFDNIHNENISNIATSKGFYTNYVDNSENSGDKVHFSVDNSKLFHKDSTFKEIYNYVDNLSKGDNVTNNSSSHSKSNININMGGITQNITQANCDTVLDELSNILLRALSGCDGIY